MSPLPTVAPQKRPLSVIDDGAQPTKKARHFYHRRHALKHPQQSLVGAEPALVGQFSDPSSTSPDGAAPAFSPQRTQIDDFLDRAIVSICEQLGRKDGITDLGIEDWAMEKMRHVVEARKNFGDYEPPWY